MDTITLVLWILIATMVLFLVCFFIYWIITIRKFKHTLIRKRVIGQDKTITKIFKFKEYIDKNGIKWIRLKKGLKSGDKIKYPDSEAITMTEKGQMFVEVYWKGGEEYTYIIPSNETDNKVAEFTGSQRALMVDQFDKAKAEQGFKWGQHIPLIVQIASIIVILALIIFGAAELMDRFIPILEKVDHSLETVTQSEIRIASIEKGVQNIEAKLNINPP